MIDNIVGLASLPLGVLLFLNVYGVTGVSSIFGINILTLAAFVLIAIQLSNIIGSHLGDHNMIVSYIVHLLLVLPSAAYFLSGVMAFPETVTTTFPLLFASFITIEGLFSFFF